MTLASFHSDVAGEIARGSSADAKIPRWTRLAAQWLEQNYDFKYMEVHGTATLDPMADEPNVLDLPNDRVKMVTLVQPFWESQGQTVFAEPLPQAERADFTSIDLGGPTGWCQIGDTLFFDAKPQQPLSLAMVYLEYTDWPVDTAATPKLLRRYENLLLAQTMLTAWRSLKDEAGQNQWANERDLALRAVLVAEEEAKWRGQNMAMIAGDVSIR